MKKWLLVLVPFFLPLFVLCGKETDKMSREAANSSRNTNNALMNTDKALMNKVPLTADVLIFIDGRNITQHPLFIEYEKDISELMSDVPLDKSILESRLLFFGSMKEEWGGLLLQSTNGQVGNLFENCLKKCKEEFEVKESSEGKERRVTIKISEEDINFDLFSILYNENLMVVAVNKDPASFKAPLKTSKSFFNTPKANPLFNKLQMDKVLLSSTIKVDFPDNGKVIKKEALDSLFQQMPFLEKLDSLSSFLPFSNNPKQTGNLHIVFKDTDSTSAALDLVNQMLAKLAKEEPNLEKALTCKVKDNALEISFQLQFLTDAFREAIEVSRKKSIAISCVSNLKQIGLGLFLYADDFNDTYPKANEWKKAIKDYVGDEKAMKCPKDKRPYRAFVNGQKNTIIKNPSTTILVICECDHQGKTNVCFADGHVEAVDSKRVKDALEKTKPGALPILK